ncbi:MAG TPA: hypothetical protein EYP78_00345 [Candidatus Omnitrophica bacterium]|nr:hypothetical protein [Candidatus Omnitrophota bacterium]
MSKIKFLSFSLLLFWFFSGFSYGAEYSIREINYTVIPQRDKAEVHATALIESLQKGGVELKFLSSDVSLLSFEGNRKRCKVIARHQGYFLYLPKKGSYSIRYSFKSPLKAEGARVYLAFKGPPSNVRKLVFEKAKVKDISVAGGVLEGNTWHLSLGRKVEVSFIPVAEEIREVIINTKLNLSNRVRENGLSSSYHWSFKIEKGKIDWNL